MMNVLEVGLVVKNTKTDTSTALLTNDSELISS